MKISLEDFIEEVKIEIAIYEDLGEEKADKWEKLFRKVLDSDKKYNKKTNEYKINDESEIFAIADSLFAASESGDEEKYWDMMKKG